MMVMLYLLLMIQNYTFQLLLCQKKIIKILLKNKIKVFKGLFIGMNIKQNQKKKMGLLMFLSILVQILLFKGVNRLFVMAHSREGGDDRPTRDGLRKYYLPRIDFKKYNVIINGRNFYDNPIESDIEKYRELKKVMIGKGEKYTTGSLLDYNYFNKHYKLLAVDLSKQKELDTNPRAIQQIEFKYILETDSDIYWVLEKCKEPILEFYKGTVKVY